MANSDLNAYKDLRREEKNHSRWFMVGLIGFSACILVAADRGSTAGWKWLLGALFFLLTSLWSLVEFRYYGLLVALHLLPHETREAMNESDDE